ncbi:D-aminoacyl-tRNA deacylase [Methylococcales bacterium]|nr:D-aminoacyl-tRNA deacylase [Methylococcales bacterium]
MRHEFDILSPDGNLIDIHCHRQTPAGHVQIVSLDTMEFAAGPWTPSPDLIAPSNNESAAKTLLVDHESRRYFSLGIHPWFIERQDRNLALQTLANASQNPKLLAIGECGLDKCIATPMSLQIEVFTRQIECAEHIGKPLIIHCVKAFNELIQIKKTCKAGPAWIIHGFNANPVLAEQLINQGCYLSLGRALLNPRGKAGQVLTRMPLDRLFLETDAAEDTQIGAIYAAAAKIVGLDIATLQEQIHGNFKRVFLND